MFTFYRDRGHTISGDLSSRTEASRHDRPRLQTRSFLFRSRNGVPCIYQRRSYTLFSFLSPSLCSLSLSVPRCLRRPCFDGDSFRRSRSGTASRCGIDDGWLALVTTHGTHRCSPSLPLPRRTRATALLPGERLPTFLSSCPPAWDVTAYIRSRAHCVCVHTIFPTDSSSRPLLLPPNRASGPIPLKDLQALAPFFFPFLAFLLSSREKPRPRSGSFSFFALAERGCFSFLSTRARQTRQRRRADVHAASTTLYNRLQRARACLRFVAASRRACFVGVRSSRLCSSTIDATGMPSCRKRLHIRFSLLYAP